MTYDTINDAVTRAEGEGSLLANRYRIIRQLGTGGMGSVWLAEDTQLDGKQFAIKMLPSILVSNKRAYRQLKDEALVAMKLTHQNIVTLRAFEENNGNPFLVMDYIDGQTVDDYLAEHTETGVSSVEHGSTGTTGILPVAGSGLPESDVLRILRPIAAALDYAHTKGVVHRDVKPANVMIAKDGTPYILDFGIAREIQETMTRVTGKLSSGTLLYMSPEQLMGEPPKPSQDIYSFAAMAYECLKGEPPFAHGQIEFQIMNKVPEPLALPTDGSSIRGSGTFAASVMAGLAKKPEDRPSTCAAVLEGNGVGRVEHVERVESGNCRVCSPSEPTGQQTVAVEGRGVGKVGAPPICIPKGYWRYLPPDMRSSVKESRTFSPRDIPEGDRRYLPPDMRAPLKKGVTYSEGKQRDEIQRQGDGVGLREGKRNAAEKSRVAYSWKPSAVLLSIVAVIVLLGAVSIHRQRKEKEARDAAIESQRQRASRIRQEQQEMAQRMENELKEREARQALQEAENKNKMEQLRIEAEKPKVYLTATLNGVCKPALITHGLAENNKYHTPLTIDVKSPLGSRGEVAVEYFEGGVKYVGKGEYIAKKGNQKIEIALKKEIKTYPRPKTMNFCRHCSHSLKEYATIGLKCPKCGKNLFGN